MMSTEAASPFPTTLPELTNSDVFGEGRDRRISLGFKPLRSSPLAGPPTASAVCSDEGHELPSTPTRMASTPNLKDGSSDTSKIKVLRRSSIFDFVRRPAPSRAKTLPSPLPHPSAEIPPLPAFAATLAKPAPLEHVPSYKAKPPAPLRLNSTPISVDMPSPPPPSSGHRSRQRSYTTNEMTMPIPVPVPQTPSSPFAKTPDLAAFPLPPPNFPVALTKSKSTRSLRTNSVVSLPPPPSSSPPMHTSSSSFASLDEPGTGDSWLASLSGEAPRFSRVGLSAPSVVLPVPAKAEKRKSLLRGEGGKRISLLGPRPSANAWGADGGGDGTGESAFRPLSSQLHVVGKGVMGSTTVPPRSSSLVAAAAPIRVFPEQVRYSNSSSTTTTTSTSTSTPSLRSSRSRSPSISSASDGSPQTPSNPVFADENLDGKTTLDVDSDEEGEEDDLDVVLASPTRIVFEQHKSLLMHARSDSFQFQNEAAVQRGGSFDEMPTMNFPPLPPPALESAPSRSRASPSSIRPPPLPRRSPARPPPPNTVSKDKDNASIVSVSDAQTQSSMWLSRPISIYGSVASRRAHRRLSKTTTITDTDASAIGSSFLWFGSGDGDSNSVWGVESDVEVDSDAEVDDLRRGSRIRAVSETGRAALRKTNTNNKAGALLGVDQDDLGHSWETRSHYSKRSARLAPAATSTVSLCTTATATATATTSSAPGAAPAQVEAGHGGMRKFFKSIASGFKRRA
uniref:Uncharacterized protein n=1 Tax=Mycena chlorophos TaxID=658473 RepID=A0ABQ0LHX0_MYCCL|nr:predicted protein [Mycena chlorophos]